MHERIRLATADGESLDAEIATAPHATVGLVLCHPHPQYGGTMQSLVISELFRALPGRGVTCLRFDFRGVGASTGSYGGGDTERLDATAAVDQLGGLGLPVVLAGWSFGADVATSVDHPAIIGWIAIALPLRFGHDQDRTGADTRPKLLLLAEHDEFRAAADVIGATNGWQHTETEVIGGASHFFVGRTDRLVEASADWIARLGLAPLN